MMTGRSGILFVISGWLLAVPAFSQDFSVKSSDPWCEKQHSHSDGKEQHVCEVREVSISPRGDLEIDASPNGGVSVRSWNKNEILVRAKITAAAESASGAEDIVDRVSISTKQTIEAKGPRTGNDEWYSVSFEILAPASTDLRIETSNGGISIDGMSGRTRFETENGGVSLVDLAGDVVGETVNGGVTVELSGDSWEGRGLDVETVNGGVSIVVPSGYSANLETGTVNGRFKTDFPIMIEDDGDPSLTAKLGKGGKPIRAVTTNGSVRISRG
jgi:hypothetical protein